MTEKKYGQDVKYCIVAMVDLQGFSSHLEIGGDLRTKVGDTAIDRLRTLDTAVSHYKLEYNSVPNIYPKEYVHTQRINDSVIFSMDLPDFFLPSINEYSFDGHTLGDWAVVMPEYEDQDYDSVEDMQLAYDEKLNVALIEVARFVGTIARIHRYISFKENEYSTPGCKTVICSGFRKSYKDLDENEDYLSANFAFSNVYVSEKSLHGPNFFVDSNILKILSLTPFTHNIVKLSSIIRIGLNFSPFSKVDYEERRAECYKIEVSKPITLTLFRRNYSFYMLNEVDFSYLHIADVLLPIIKELNNGNKKMGKIFASQLSLLNKELDLKDLSSNSRSIPPLPDISKPIQANIDILVKSI
jgi:hypothetical protein